MAPSVGYSNPPIILRVVVFPHPEGPSREKNSPSSTVKERLSTATVSLKTFDTSSRRTDDICCLPVNREPFRTRLDDERTQHRDTTMLSHRVSSQCGCVSSA